jgi:hypothetical protein
MRNVAELSASSVSAIAPCGSATATTSRCDGSMARACGRAARPVLAEPVSDRRFGLQGAPRTISIPATDPMDRLLVLSRDRTARMLAVPALAEHDG